MKMKKFLAMMMLSIFTVASLTACGGSEEPKEEAVVEESTEEAVAEETADEETPPVETEEEVEEADPYEGLTLYEAECGASIYMADGYVESEAEGVEVFYEGELSNVTLSKETFETLQPVLEQGGYDSVLTSEDYGRLIYEVYQIEGSELLTNEYGDLYITYELMYDGMGVTYFVYFDEGDGAWWTTNMMCPTEVAADMEADFHLWASSIQVP